MGETTQKLRPTRKQKKTVGENRKRKSSKKCKSPPPPSTPPAPSSPSSPSSSSSSSPPRTPSPWKKIPLNQRKETYSISYFLQKMKEEDLENEKQIKKLTAAAKRTRTSCSSASQKRVSSSSSASFELPEAESPEEISKKSSSTDTEVEVEDKDWSPEDGLEEVERSFGWTRGEKRESPGTSSRYKTRSQTSRQRYSSIANEAEEQLGLQNLIKESLNLSDCDFSGNPTFAGANIGGPSSSTSSSSAGVGVRRNPPRSSTRGKRIYESDDETVANEVNLDALMLSLDKDIYEPISPPPNVPIWSPPEASGATTETEEVQNVQKSVLETSNDSVIPQNPLDAKLSEFNKIFGVTLSPSRWEYAKTVPLGADENTWLAAAEVSLEFILNAKPVWNKNKVMIYRGHGEKNDWSPLRRFDVLMRCAKWIVGGEAIESLRDIKTHIDFVSTELTYFPLPEEMTSKVDGHRPLNPVTVLCRVNVWKPFVLRLLEVIFPSDAKAVTQTYDHLRSLRKPQRSERSVSSTSEDSEEVVDSADVS